MGSLLPLLMLLAAPPVEAASADAGVVGLELGVVFDPTADDLDDAETEISADATAACAADGGLLYSADVSDEALARAFVDDPASLGSISVGVAEGGRVLNAVQMPPGGISWTVIDPANAWGTQETIDALRFVADDVHTVFPDAVLHVGHIGRKSGGWLSPHISHQSGRDVDLSFYYVGALKQTREQSIDLARNWALLKSLIVNSDVQFVLVDHRIQRVLYDYAASLGEKREWLNKLFFGRDTLVKHARRHRDHFHVRFFAPRSQELGRRIQPVLAARAEENVVIVHVQKGDSLGRLASRYNSTTKAIQQANGLTTNALRVGRTLNIPVRGPCTQCPKPPPLLMPPRLLPPPPDPAS